MSTINQCRMNKGSKLLFSDFMHKYSLRDIKNRNKPCIFFGVYWNDITTLLSHKSLAIAVWRGSDAMSDNRIKKCKKKSNIKHVAISSFIENDFKRLGVEYKFLPIIGTNAKMFKPCPLGDEIYTYIPNSKPDFYGLEIIKDIQRKSKFKINIIGGDKRYTRQELVDIYKRCFIGIRLTPHDGIANSVIELGLMGRRSIYNDSRVPGAIHWDRGNVNKIMESINIESKKIGQTNLFLYKLVKSYIDIGKDWLKPKFWI